MGTRADRLPHRALRVASVAILAAAASVSTGAAEASPSAVVYGAAGTFGQVADGALHPGAAQLRTEPVAGWTFRPGQAAYFSALAPDGTVLLANEPQTDDQYKPTSDEMVVSSFDPDRLAFRNIVVPTSTGRTSVSGPWAGAHVALGGADVADLQPVTRDGQTRIAFLSAVPYFGWDAASGQYPTLGFLSAGADGWSYDRGRSVVANQIESAASTSLRTRSAGTPCDVRTGPGGDVADCHAPAEMAQLPASGDLVVSQYVGAAGGSNGSLMVLGTNGDPKAVFSYPEMHDASGRAIAVHPREVDASPVGEVGDERFVVIFDAEATDGDGGSIDVPFAMQELRFDADAGTITPLSTPVLSGDAARGFETAQFDARGDLWAAQAQPGSLDGGDLVRYARRADGSVLGGPGCGVGENWDGGGWGTTCTPTQRFSEAAPLGIVRSLTEDPRTGAMLAMTMSGALLAVVPQGGSFVARPPVDLGLNRLVDRDERWIGPRKGSVDVARGALWVPVQQLQSPTTCAQYPCAPTQLDQWLYRIDLDSVEAPGGNGVASTAPTPSPVAPSAANTAAPVTAHTTGRVATTIALQVSGRGYQRRVTGRLIGGMTSRRAVVQLTWQRRVGRRWRIEVSNRTTTAGPFSVRRTVAGGRWRVRARTSTASSTWSAFRVGRAGA